MSNRHILANAAETYGVALPDYLTTAKALLEAAETYKADVAALTPPTLEGVTAKTIAKTIDAVLAFAQRDDRLKLASRVEAIADAAVEFAYMRFQETLMTDLAKPFDKAASKFMAVYDANPHAAQDPATVATLCDLIRLRDQMAGRVGASTPTGDLYDLPTRVTTLPNKDVLARKIPVRVGNLRHDSVEWLNAMLSIEGIRLKWQTPAEQAAHIATLPRYSEAYTASASA